MRHVISFLFMIVAVGLAQAQDATPQEPASQEDRGYLQSLIEDNLSTEGTQVRLVGFNGSLTSASSIDQLTIADADGVWLTMTDLVLDWNRRALFSRRLEVTELSVETIELDRWPPPGESAPSAEAKPFKLPELPLEIDIREIRAGSIALGPSILGAAATLSLEGSATLSGGSGQVNLQANRLDGPTGQFTIAAGYSNETDVLDLDVQLEEAPNGIATNLLNLQGRPSVRMTIVGSAPLSRYEARLELATGGVQRVSGQVTMLRAATSTPDSDQPVREFSARLSGDVAPLFAPALAPFFGDNVILSVDGRSLPDGRTQISALAAETAALRISGMLDFAANGLPERFDLTGRIAGASGQPVTLPLPGGGTTLTRADLTAKFDAATGDEWQATATVKEFSRNGLTIGTTELDAEGTIATTGPRRISANIGFSASGIVHTDVTVARALGRQLTGAAALLWSDGTPLRLTPD